MKFFLCLMFVFFSTGLFSQSQQERQRKVDSLDQKLREDSASIYHFKKIRPFLNFHNRNSLNEIKPVNFYGFQGGIVFFERHIVGYGRYFSTEKSKKAYTYFEGSDEITRTLSIDYHTIFYQFIFLSHRWFEFHVPLELGYGTVYSKKYFQSAGTEINSDENMFVTSYGLQIILKPVRWAGITSNFGYRGSSEKLVDGFYYAIGFWIGLKPVMEDFNYYLIKKRRYNRAKSLLLKN